MRCCLVNLQLSGAIDQIRSRALSERWRNSNEVLRWLLFPTALKKCRRAVWKSSGLGGRFFDGVFVSGLVGATKPARKIFDTALNTLGIENRKKVLMIGDSLKADIAGGTGAGIDTCWCNFRGAVLPAGRSAADLHDPGI